MKTAIKWTMQTLKKEASNYSHKSDFRKRSPRAYKAAIYWGVLPEVTKHMINNYTQWTKKMILAEAVKYTCKTEFRTKALNAYLAARRRGILAEVTEKMTKKASLNKRAIYAFLFKDNTAYVGLTCDYERRYCQHMKKNQIVIKKTEEMGHEFVMYNVYYDMGDAEKYELKKAKELMSKGYTLLNKRMGGLGGGYAKWDVKKAIKEAKKHQTRDSFYKNAAGAYNVLLRERRLDDAYRHMTHRKYNWWSLNGLESEAKKYRTRMDFQKGSPSAYVVARRRGVLSTICKHMNLTKRQKWTREEILEEVEGNKFKSYSEFRKYKKGSLALAAGRKKMLHQIKELLK